MRHPDEERPHVGSTMGGVDQALLDETKAQGEAENRKRCRILILAVNPGGTLFRPWCQRHLEHVGEAKRSKEHVRADGEQHVEEQAA